MNKKNLGLLNIALFISILMTSCLGDTESFITRNNTFVVINEDPSTYKKYVMTPDKLGFRFDGIDSYSKGDVLRMSYKVNIEKNDGTFFIGENVVIDNENIFPTTSQPVLQMSSTPEITKDMTIESVFIEWPDSYEIFNNRWVFNYSATQYNTESLNLEFYFDEKKQENLANNIIVVDVLLKRGHLGNETNERKVTKYTAANLEKLRNYLKNITNFDGIEYKNYTISFQAYKYNEITDQIESLTKNAGIKINK